MKSTAPGLRLFDGSITRFGKKYFLQFIELKGTYNVYGWFVIIRVLSLAFAC